MEFGGEILEKVKKTLGILSGNHPVKNSHADFLIKMNLPPVMARRDAAGECVGKALSREIFDLPEEERLAIYRATVSLLDHVCADTVHLIDMLTSPDTISRERRMLNYWEILHGLAFALQTLTETCYKLNDQSGASDSFSSELHNESKSTIQCLGDGELQLVNRFREILSFAEKSIVRYREYTAKSFSMPNATRYRKAYDEYIRLYEI